MKAIFINGSPRKNWNTYELLNEAMRGAAEAGADTELVQLSDYSFKGCHSCFACKLKDSKTNGICAVRDELRPVLERVMEADILVIGSPIYFGDLTAGTIAFLERLKFPVLEYKPPVNGKRTRILPKEKKTGLILDMNCPEPATEKNGYQARFAGVANALGSLVGDGECPIVYSFNTWQFTEYDKYDVTMFDVADKARQRKEQFPKDLKNAYELGRKLAEKCSGK